MTLQFFIKREMCVYHRYTCLFAIFFAVLFFTTAVHAKTLDIAVIEAQKAEGLHEGIYIGRILQELSKVLVLPQDSVLPDPVQVPESQQKVRDIRSQVTISAPH